MTTGGDPLERGEVEAVLETRRELGATYDAALVDSFAERIEAAVAARVAGEIAARERGDEVQQSGGQRQLALGIVSAGVGVPVTAISLAVEGGLTGLVAMIVGWGGLVGINIAHAVQSRARG